MPSNHETTTELGTTDYTTTASTQATTKAANDPPVVEGNIAQTKYDADQTTNHISEDEASWTATDPSDLNTKDENFTGADNEINQKTRDTLASGQAEGGAVTDPGPSWTSSVTEEESTTEQDMNHDPATDEVKTAKESWLHTHSTQQTNSTTGRKVRKQVNTSKFHKIAVAIRQSIYGFNPPLIICNSITFIVMNMKHNRDRSACVYMAALAGVDTMALLYGLLHKLPRNLKLSATRNSVCKFNVYSIHVIWTLSAFYIVAMCFDRCYAIVQPHKAKIKCTAKRARITCVSLFLVVLMFYAPLVYLQEEILSTVVLGTTWKLGMSLPTCTFP